jgi:hypothetical protein
MSKSFLDNAKKAKWTLAFLFGAIFIQDRQFKKFLKKDYFGEDGNF